MYPAGKIPVLQDGNFTLGESGAIMAYLCEKNPHVGYLIGESPQERATINQYVSWYQNYFRPAMFKPIRMYLGGVLMGQKILQAHKDSLFGEMFEAIKKL
jgi:glutathione S-transferase